jgi:ABC-type multidrug transport system ATPase subunit
VNTVSRKLSPESLAQHVEFRCSFTRERVLAEVLSGYEYVLGSAEGAGIVLQGKGVREGHALLRLDAGVMSVEPLGGVPVAINGHLISATTPIADGDWLSLDSALFQVFLPDQSAAAHGAGRRVSPKPGILTIGRLPESDLEIASPLVSREHARLHCHADRVELEDLHSTNGTFINGQRLQGRVRLEPGDRVAIASFAFVFNGEALEPVDSTGRVRMEVRDLRKEVIDRATGEPRRLLDGINLVIEPGEFVAIFGTSGSGKSTLLDALNGRRPATSGQVLYNGEDLYRSFDAFRSGIGYVPQQDIVHRKISVRHALEYTARLRLPPDTSDDEVASHIERVLDKVGLADKATQAIDTPAPLSGGQLKRVSLAVELVADPNILFLDEVTSGLDAGTDKRMMRLFADLAADQKTVVCVTHTLENIDVCHLVVLLHKGKLVYFGPPVEAAGYFGVARLSDVYELLESSPPNVWSDRYLGSVYCREYILNRLTFQDNGDGPPTQLDDPEARPSRHWFDGRQAGTLMRRYLDLIVSDRRNLLILLLQAPLIGAMIGLVFDTEGAPAVRAAAESQIAFILVLSAIWFGTLNSVRELVKELPIYLRERSVNLGLFPYLASKLLPLAALCLLQCTLLLGIVSALVSLPGSFVEQVACLFMAGLAATAMGLAVSAFVDTNDKAVAIAPILLIPQVVLSNAVVRLGDVGLLVAKFTMISFWSLDAMKTTLSAESRAARDLGGQLIVPVTGACGADLARVAAMGLVFLALTVLGLKWKDQRK